MSNGEQCIVYYLMSEQPILLGLYIHNLVHNQMGLGTLGEIEIFKMAATNVTNITTAII